MLIPSSESIPNCSKVLSIETAPRGIRLADAIIDITFSAIWSGIARSRSCGARSREDILSCCPEKDLSVVLPMRSRFARYVKVNLEFVFDFYGASGHAYWSNAKIPLFQDGIPLIVSVGTEDLHRYWL